MPHPHIGVGIVGVVVLISRGYVNDHVPVLAARFEQALHPGNDLFVHLAHVACERIARPRPRIGEIDTDDRRLLAEADAPLKAALLVDFGARFERLLQHGVQVLDFHWLLLVQ